MIWINSLLSCSLLFSAHHISPFDKDELSMNGLSSITLRAKPSNLRGTYLGLRKVYLSSQLNQSSYYGTSKTKLFSSTSSFSSATESSSITRIAFMTDTEGDATYFDRFVESSKVLGFGPNHEVIFLNEKGNVNDGDKDGNGASHDNHNLDSIFVYGGDTTDKGGSDLYVLRQLISLQERYGPERVHFIMGNRDINKIRISQELDSFEDSNRDNKPTLPKHDGCWWLKGTNRIGDPDLCHDEKYQVPTDATDRLKWMLQNTMGCPNSFDFRRMELENEQLEKFAKADMKNREKTTCVTDEDVTRSYIETSKPDGLMGQYLRNAKLILKIGKVLFMHGGLPLTKDILQEQQQRQKENPLEFAQPYWNEETLPMPWKSSQYKEDVLDDTTPHDKKLQSSPVTAKINPIDTWISNLNSFAKSEIEKWSQSFGNQENISQEKQIKVENDDNRPSVWASRGGYHNTKNGEALTQYGMGGMPNRVPNPTVVYSSWCSYGMPKIISPPISPYFDEPQVYLKLLRDFFSVSKNLDVIITGHQPHGDLPLPIQVNYSPEGDNLEWNIEKSNDCKRGWIISCDTSYSGDTHWINSSRENLGHGKSSSWRGDVAVSEMIIDQNLKTGTITNVFSHGVLSDGSPYQSENLMEINSASCQVGTIIDKDSIEFEGKIEDPNSLDQIKQIINENDLEKWWVKCKLKDGRHIVSSAKNYEVWNGVATIR